MTTPRPPSGPSSTARWPQQRCSTTSPGRSTCSYGDYTAGQYLWQANYFRGTRAYDLARVIGVDPALPDGLVQGLWDELVPVADEWRAIGVMAAEVPVPTDAPLLDRLLGLTGRDPSG